MVLAMAAGASAADLPPVPAYSRAPPPMWGWTGCYVGGNIGFGWQNNSAFDPFLGFDTGTDTGTGFVGGGQVGCDFQTTNLVFGIQGEFDFGNINGRHAVAAFPTFSETNSLRQIYLITGRVGYLWTPQFLGYVKVGAAFMNNRNQVFQPSGALSESATFTDPGVTAGIGGEWMFAPDWSVFAEWNYIWTEDDSAHDFRAAPGLFPPGEVINIRQRAQTALIGLNYKFHWDNGPVVAKY